MSTLRRLTAVIEREGDGYVALCPEFDIASQGDTVEDARSNLGIYLLDSPGILIGKKIANGPSGLP